MLLDMFDILLVSQYDLPDDDNQWLKHGAVAIRSDAFGDNQGSEKD
jgi:hypothetical protein